MYCTKADLTKRFGTDEIAALTGGDDGVLNAAMEDAATAIDASLRGRYTLPFESAPAELVPIACDLTRFTLYKDAAPEIVTKRFDAANARLRGYAKGENVLDIPGQEDDASPQGAALGTTATQVFSDDTLGMIPS